MPKSEQNGASKGHVQAIEEYLARGGKINVVEPGVSGEDDDFNWNQSRHPAHKKAVEKQIGSLTPSEVIASV